MESMMPTPRKTQGVQANSKRAKSTETWKVRSRAANDCTRGRSHLTPNEVQTICTSIKTGSRYSDRDELMVLMAFHHGLRVGELVGLQWQHVNLKNRQLKVIRLKDGIDTTHPISSKREIMLLNRLHKAQGKPVSGFIFNTERNTPVSVNGFQKLFSKFSEQALGVKWNAHALRHGCGTQLVEKGVHLMVIKDYLGHKNIQNTTRYLHESGAQFKDIQW